jgi:hypothetical protein
VQYSTYTCIRLRKKSAIARDHIPLWAEHWNSPGWLRDTPIPGEYCALKKKFFCLLLFEGTFTSFFKDKSQKEVTKQ